ncbi:MAG: hypothetical protein ACK4NS_08085 [Saprospiraceae bacterium]
MKKLVFAALVLALTLALSTQSACYYDNEEELYGAGQCDTVNIRYSVEVAGILQTHCYSCHSTSSNVAGSPFETYEKLRPYAMSNLVARMKGTANPMPPSGRLRDCDIAKVEAWVRAGALNN